ncbi:MAG: Dabb family protein [Planctomycetes bacterium]|nr:Dabb family protein [Planctomycetota bacterium]
MSTTGPQVVHNVFFTLHESSPANRQKLVDACHKYLSGHPGVVYFSAGILCDSLARPVNDREFDVGLHVVFRSMADHDTYQQDPRHLKFIEENKPTWKKVRVFDSEV